MRYQEDSQAQVVTKSAYELIKGASRDRIEPRCRLIKKEEFGLKRDALAARTVKFLGFARGGPKLVAAADAAIGQLLEQGALSTDTQGFLVEK